MNLPFLLSLFSTLIPGTVSDLYSKLHPFPETDSNRALCGARADFWTAQAESITGLRPKKILVLYGWDQSPKRWAFHIAPVAPTQYPGVSSAFVLEKANRIQAPLTVPAWLSAHHGKLDCTFWSDLPPWINEVYQKKFISGSTTDFFWVLNTQKIPGACHVMLVDASVHGPLFGTHLTRLDPPATAMSADDDPEPFSKQRAIKACMALDREWHRNIITGEWSAPIDEAVDVKLRKDCEARI